MSNSVFVELRFWLLVLCSLVAPLAIYATMLFKRAISRKTVLLLGVVLVGIAGLDVYLMQILSAKARLTPSLADDGCSAPSCRWRCTCCRCCLAAWA